MKRILILIALLIPGLGWSEHIGDYTAKLTIGDWHPDVDEIVSALDYLKHDLAIWDKEAKAFPFREYRYQYYGVTKNSRRIVVINAFCSRFWARASDWKRTLIVVKDGGSCFYRAEFDVKHGKIISVVFNGEA